MHVLDAKVTLDGNSTFRHEDYTQFDETQPRDEHEQAAHAKACGTSVSTAASA